MHAHFLDPYREGASPIHRLDGRVKLVLAIAFIFTVGLTPIGAWPIYVLLFAAVLSVVLASELGLGYVLKRALLALPFVLAALPALFTVKGEPLATLPFGAWTLTISAGGVERFASVVIKSWLSVQMAIVLAATTPFPDLLAALRSLRLPRLLVAIIGLMWRYLFVLVDEVLRLARARESRSGARAGQRAAEGRPGGSLVWRARVTGGMAGNLFLRSFDRAERIYAAMAARGYDGEVRTLSRPPLSSQAWLIVAAGLTFLILLLALSLFL